MAKHLTEGRFSTLFLSGQPYGLAIVEVGLVAGAFVDAKEGVPVTAGVDNVVLVQRLMESM